jgi:sarcosine oxidase subunit beta
MNPPKQSPDWAVIGAGITGLSMAWHLLERSAGRVVVFDAVGIGSGATSVQPGGVRQQWGSRLTCAMARQSYIFYQTLNERLQPRVNPGWKACGYLFVAHQPSTLDELSAHVALQNELGVPSRMVTATEAGELVPAVDPAAIVGGSWCDEDGYFDRPQAVVSAFAEACRRAGADFVDSRVRQLRPDGTGWCVTAADGVSTRAGNVIVAAGYDSPSLLAPLGIDVPVEKEPRYLFYSDPVHERLLEPLVVAPDRHFAAKQLADGSVLASELSATGDPQTNRADWYGSLRATARALVPILEYVSFPVLVEGFYDVTPDRQPILGPVESHDGLWIAAGLNGRGFMLAPEIGRLLVDAATGTSIEATLPALALGRFERDELFPEGQVV